MVKCCFKGWEITPCNRSNFRNGGHVGGQVEMVNFCAIVGCVNRAERDKIRIFIACLSLLKGKGHRWSN